MKAAVIGFPAQHSLSPLIHTYWIEKYGLQGTYEAREMAPDNLQRDVARMVEEGFDGFNVTMPHKQAMMDLCDETDETAQQIGAVNTVVIKDRRLTGMNTDWFGLTENLADSAPDFDFADARVLILGAGGAARAAIYGLRRRGVEKMTLANRTDKTAQRLAEAFGVEACLWERRHEAVREATLLVNTTAGGMAGKHALDFDVATLPPRATIYDIVYNPRETALLRAARARGLRAVEGLGMLLHQARPAFHAWTGIMPEVTGELRARLQAKVAG